MTTHDNEQGNSQLEDIEANLSLAEEEAELTPQDMDADKGDDAPEGAEELEALDGSEGEEPTEQEILDALEPPQKWDSRYKEVFNEWGQHDKGREWQEAIAELYNEGQSYTTKVEQERAEYLKARDEYQGYINGWNEVLSPYDRMFTDAGAGPDQFVRQGLGLLQQLKADPQATIRNLARDANIDLTSLQIEQQYEDPASKKIRELEQRLNQEAQERHAAQQRQAQESLAARQAENRNRVIAFAEATDETGNPLHPHIEQVELTMAELIQGREAQRQYNQDLPSLDLEEAYQRACRLDPNLAQASSKEAEMKALSQKNAAAKKANAAAKRVAGGSSAKGGPKLTLKQEITKNLRAQAG
jgi:hypothetical protein